MNRLVLETSSEACSVVLQTAHGMLLERATGEPRAHGRVLVPWIGELLAEAGLSYSQLDRIAVDRGPGGFTSLRLGLGVAQGIALAQDLPVHPVSSLAALALAARPTAYRGDVLAAIDARMGEVYWAWFRFDGDLPEPLGAEQLSAPAQVEIIGEGEFIGVGSGFSAYAEIIEEAAGPRLKQVDAEAAPTARAVGLLAELSEPVAAHELEPVYLRDRVTHQGRNAPA
ncbi:MAG: tRNA (adenosine(37)-N6)-threonylcarbamoyltransferase complex dimerization subunit type 1 TsaB [Wenzhouxiangellaceae bacterium]|nr:tRNA (adenosine(37)-N6)-threonylcarbamoyltransferase complex dimerization subunit type 1 TsaB [Wenzhouxiangellaceae bacterium]